MVVSHQHTPDMPIEWLEALVKEVVKKVVPADASISADVGIGPIPAGFGIQVAMRISIPGWPKADVQALVDAAHKVCPYSNATRGNIDVTVTVVDD